MQLNFTPRERLTDFTLSNARRFYSSKGNPLGLKGFIVSIVIRLNFTLTVFLVDVYYFELYSVPLQDVCTQAARRLHAKRLTQGPLFFCKIGKPRVQLFTLIFF